MKNKYLLLGLALSFIFFSCKKETKIANAEQYNSYLESVENKKLDETVKDLAFWENKLNNHPEQYIYLAKIASNEGQLFGETGKIDYLKSQEEKLTSLNLKTKNNNAGYLRSLAKNYITQHRFKEALDLLLIAEKNGEKLIGTQKMLFDVYLELGNTNKAEKYLEKIKDFRSFDYLIRLSKWKDHEGDLDNAIFYMEKAKDIAVNSKNKELQQWVYTNIADYYGHAGKIEKSYQHYLKALEIDPNDTYAKKGIAWIVFSHEKNTDEALRILNTLDNDTPDYDLLKAEIANYNQQEDLAKHFMESYLTKINDPKYGFMYAKYAILLYAEEFNEASMAIQLSELEIKNRPTVQSYDLLAWSYLHQGNAKKALDIINRYVVDKTSEPEVLYHIAEIYKANNLPIKKSLKTELVQSSFELGPNLTKRIQLL